jgi:hypothetical protein
MGGILAVPQQRHKSFGDLAPGDAIQVLLGCGQGSGVI